MTTANFQTKPKKTGNILNIVLWGLQILLFLLFLMVGISKLLGTELMIAEFEKVGIGQWFRYFVGSLEIICAIALLTQRFAGLSGIVLAAVMTGAIFTHLFVIGGSPALPLILLTVAVIIAWGRQPEKCAFLGQQPPREIYE